MKKPRLIIDVALCQGCNNCFLACRDEHLGNDWPGYSRPQSRHGERWIRIPCNERGQYPLVDVTYRPTPCTHCADAPCVSRSDGLISKRADGIVLIDPAKAAGRPEIVDACPYGMISWSDESGVPQKCTLCAHLLDTGWAEPRCVQACGPGALSFVYEDDAEFQARVEAEGIETLHGGSALDSGVCYKNLRRYDSCFIGGSVAVRRGESVDCAPGALVTLRKLEGAQADVPLHTSPSQTVLTDAFGDFKFDGLDPDSGEYEVTVALDGVTRDGGEPVNARVTLGRSLSLETIVVEGKN